MFVEQLRIYAVRVWRRFIFRTHDSDGSSQIPVFYLGCHCLGQYSCRVTLLGSVDDRLIISVVWLDYPFLNSIRQVMPFPPSHWLEEHVPTEIQQILPGENIIGPTDRWCTVSEARRTVWRKPVWLI